MPEADLVPIAIAGSGCRLTEVELATSSEILSAPTGRKLAEAVYGWLTEMAPAQGVLWRAGAAPMVFTDWSRVMPAGVPLCVDFAIDEETSGQLRHLSGNRWRRCSFVEGKAEGASGVRVAAEDFSVLSAEKSLRSLDYRRYWSIGQDGTARVVAQRFIGVTGAR